MRRRRTLREGALFEGIGLHTGSSVSVRIEPTGMSGVFFRFGDALYPVREASVPDVDRCTTLLFPGGERVQTVEHLLGAVVGMWLDDVVIETAGEELPILDGSALPFAERIAEIGFVENPDPMRERFLLSPVAVEEKGASCVALPSDSLRVTYVVDYENTSVGPETVRCVVTDESFLDDLAPARTFVFLSEVEALRRNGLARGGTLDNALVIGENGPVNEGGFRIANERAAHKALDLLGDLALTGFRVNAHFICICGGHGLHTRLALRLRGLFPS